VTQAKYGGTLCSVAEANTKDPTVYDFIDRKHPEQVKPDTRSGFVGVRGWRGDGMTACCPYTPCAPCGPHLPG
jgi:hypothetical protein